MKIAIFGLGYVGVISAGCLAKEGHRVVGVDSNPVKVEAVRRGETPVVEEAIGELIAAAVADGTLTATTDSAAAVRASDVVIVCVGTPSRPNGHLDLSYVKTVCQQIGAGLREKDEFCAVVIRSTVLPGTMKGVIIPLLEAVSDKTAGEDFGVAFFPEFLREGTAVNDFYNPPKVVFAASDDRTAAILEGLNARFTVPKIRTQYEAAEMVKYADNAWHAIKVAFANEIGSISKAVNVDGGEVMDIFCQDTKLNISPAYLRPGFAFGGSCLPKDVRALTYKARSLDLDTPLLNSVIPSNERHIERALRMVLDLDERRVGVLGLSFKAGTDDLRESPVVELVERLLGKGHEIRIFDNTINLSRLVGANRAYLFDRLPHIADLLVDDVDSVINQGGTVVVGTRDRTFMDALRRLNRSQRVIDLVRVSETQQPIGPYNGLCW